MEAMSEKVFGEHVDVADLRKLTEVINLGEDST
jgi:hypothetical protein